MWNRANALIFGVDPRQSLRVHRFFHAAGVYLACVVLLCLGVATGLSDTRNAVQLVAYLVTGLSCFYIAIRSGFNLRFADPALTIPQMAFGATAIAAAYLAVPSARSMTTMLTCLVLVYGAFTLTPRNCRRLGWFCVLTHIFA